MKRIGVNGDIAGGALTSTQTFVTIEGKPVIVLGSPVAVHGTGSHVSATMKEALDFITIEGLGICVDGDKATCDDALIATGFVTAEG